MEAVELRTLKKDEYFILKPLENPKDNQVWLKGTYDRGSKAWSAINFDDCSRERFFHGKRIVYVGFTF